MEYTNLSDFDLLKMVVGDAAYYLKKRPLSDLLGLRLPRQGVLCDSASFGVPPALGAIKELFVRASDEAAKDDREFLNDPKLMTAFLTSRYAALDHEVFVCLWLDAKHRLIACDEMFHGTLNQTSVYPREVVKRALERNASSVVFCHNHPSGDPAPSMADKMLTRVLKDALALVDISVLDHVIVAGAQTLSMITKGYV